MERDKTMQAYLVVEDQWREDLEEAIDDMNYSENMFRQPKVEDTFEEQFGSTEIDWLFEGE